MNQPNESLTTQELTTACTNYLLERFNYQARIAEVSEQLSTEPDKLDAALVAFMLDSGLLLRVTVENAAKAICERSAAKLVKQYGDRWQSELERDMWSDH